MECTNKCCKGNEATTFIDFELLTDLGIKRQMEYVCDSCATKLLIHGLGNRQQLQFKLYRYMSIDDYNRLIDTFVP